ncbi:MAG: type III PLP-dependent enzyme [Deltaproteobacteria bacterium]|nr:type III PLP-dependent enzyme [Deltaproteobacteria bacterium]
MTPLAEQLIARCFGRAGGELLVGGRRVSELLAAAGTPAFVYDLGVLAQTWTRLRAGLPAAVDLYYSVKANPNPAILQALVERGAGLEVASGGELRRARAAGCVAQRIAFAGPGKTDAELALAVASAIGEIHLESLCEAERVAAIARRHGVSAPVALRVNPGPGVSGGALRMGGKPSPFGIDEEVLREVVARVVAEPALTLRGIHLYVGTQILDHGTLLAQYRQGLDIARRVAAWSGRPLATVDLGGGLGVPYFANEAELDVPSFCRGLGELLGGTRGEAAFAGTRFVLEPGRYLVAEAGVYVARVVDVKTSRGKRFVVLDGGMHHHLAASGNLGQVIKRNFPLAVLNKLDQPAREVVDVVGPLCTPLDVLGRDVRLPAVAAGDLIGVFQSGAYALSASPLEFLSRASPAEVLVADGQARIIRPPVPG